MISRDALTSGQNKMLFCKMCVLNLFNTVLATISLSRSYIFWVKTNNNGICVTYVFRFCTNPFCLEIRRKLRTCIIKIISRTGRILLAVSESESDWRQSGLNQKLRVVFADAMDILWYIFKGMT